MNVLGQDFGKDWVLYQGDCVEVSKGLPDASMHFLLASV